MNFEKRLIYTRDLSIGNAAYFVEGKDNTDSPDQPLVVKKGMVEGDVFSSEKERKEYVGIGFVSPEGWVVSVPKPVKEIFTRKEVAAVIKRDPELTGDRSVDEVVEDQVANRLLVGALGGVVFKRTADDFLTNSSNTEEA